MMAGRPKSIVTQAMVTSVKKRLKGAKKRLHSIRFRGYVAALWLSWYHSSQGW